MNYIEHIIRPEKLLLLWLPSSGHRMNRIVAELAREGDNASLRYLCGENDFELAVKEGFEGYPYLPFKKEKYPHILDFFVKRIPPRSRGDFSKYMDSIRIRPDVEIDDFTLLGYSGAKLPDDDFSLINPMEQAPVPFELLMDVSGTRYSDNKEYYNQLAIGEKVQFVCEPENKWDKDAIAVFCNNIRIGYVCRGILQEFHRWITDKYSIDGFVEKKNGTSEKPKIHLFIRVT